MVNVLNFSVGCFMVLWWAASFAFVSKRWSASPADRTLINVDGPLDYSPDSDDRKSGDF